MGIIFQKNRERKMADIDAVIRKCVDDIWTEYDKDNSGSLDKEETKKFVQNTLSEITTPVSSPRTTSRPASKSSTRTVPAPSRRTRWPSSSRRSLVSEQLSK